MNSRTTPSRPGPGQAAAGGDDARVLVGEHRPTPAPAAAASCPIPLRAIDDVILARAAQVERHGHTPAADAALPLDHLPREARSYVTDALEDLQFDRHHDGPRRARAKLVKAAALVIAAIDRLDHEPPHEDLPL